MMTKKIFFSLAILFVIFGFSIGYYLVNPIYSKNEFPEFFREGHLRRTIEIESSQEIQNRMKIFRAKGICGFNYRIRVSPTSGNPILALDCQSKRWINLSVYLKPSTLDKFAVLDRDGSFVIATPAEKGKNTLQEYISEIPVVMDELVQLWPKILQGQLNQQRKNELDALQSEQRTKEVEKSFH